MYNQLCNTVHNSIFLVFLKGKLPYLKKERGWERQKHISPQMKNGHSFFYSIRPTLEFLPVLGPLERYMKPKLDAALLCSSRQVLIWVISQIGLSRFVDWVSSFPSRAQMFLWGKRRQCCMRIHLSKNHNRITYVCRLYKFIVSSRIQSTVCRRCIIYWMKN